MRVQESVMGRELTSLLRNQPNQVALEGLYTKAGSQRGEQEEFRGLCAAAQKKNVTLRVVKP